MEINANWIRWLYASCAKHFDGVKGSYHLYIEGAERATSGLENFGEFRMDGPFIKRPCKGLVYLDVEINLLIQAVMDPQRIYDGLVCLGQFATGFTNVIKVYKYGDGVDDDDSLLGCLRQRDRKNENTIDVGNFGIIRQDTRITQYTLEGHYRLELQE